MRNSIFRDGVVAGVLGATAVAIWFFVIDLVLGRLLFTPIELGRTLFSLFGQGYNNGDVMLAVGYTVFHYIAFIIVGLVAAVIVHWAEREPTVLAGALILFVAIEIGFYALSSVLAQSPAFGIASWYQIAIGNLIAALVMGTYLWRQNPALREQLDFALGGSERP